MKLITLIMTLVFGLSTAFAQADAAKKAAEAKVEDKAGKAKKKAETKVEDVKKKTETKVEDTKKKAETKVDDVKKKTDEKKAVAKKAAPAGGPVNLNTASKTALMELPGVGEANADHIIKGRPYKAVDDLITRKIVQQRYYDEFKTMVTVK